MGEKTEIRKSRIVPKKIVAFACMMLGIIILSAAAAMFTQTKDASAAKKKAKQVDEYVTMSLKNGVLTVKGKAEMSDPISTTAYKGKNIKKVVIKEGVTAIGDYVFKDCKKLTSIKIASTVKKIGIRAFQNSAIKSITIPKTVKKIGELAFDGCEKLGNITMPGNIGVIKIVYNDGIEYQPSSFLGNSCKSLKKVKFTTALNIAMIKRVGKSGGFEVMSNDPKYKSVDGLLYSKDGKTLLRIPLGRKKVVISDKCTTVTAGSYGYDMYWTKSTMSEIVFPNSVKEIISDGAMVNIDHYECKDIKVILNMNQLDEESIKLLWRTNKYWKNSLKDELLRKGFAKLNEENERMLMLSDGYLCGYIMKEGSNIDDASTWEKIDGLVIPDNVKTIGSNAFAGYIICSMTLGSSVECIDTSAFGGDLSKAGLTEDNSKESKEYAVIYIKSNNIQIKDNAFDLGSYGYGYVKLVNL